MVQTTFDAAETADRTNNPSTPIYTYPGFQYESVLHYVDIDDVPLVAHIVRQITARCTFAGAPIVLNHAIGTRYDDGEKMIGFHSDKVHDIAADTPILMLSFGGRRELHWRRAEAPNDFVESFVMEPGSLFVLGWQTNLALQHSIVPAADERVLDRAVEPVAPRISLVLRHIATAMTHDALLRQIERSRRGKTKRADNKQSKQQQSKQQHNKKQQSKKRTASEIVE